MEQSRIVMSLEPKITKDLKKYADKKYIKISALVRNIAEAYLKNQIKREKTNGTKRRKRKTS